MSKLVKIGNFWINPESVDAVWQEGVFEAGDKGWSLIELRGGGRHRINGVSLSETLALLSGSGEGAAGATA